MKPVQFMWPDAPTSELLAMVAENHIHHSRSVEIDYREWACPALREFMGHVLRVLAPFPQKGQLKSFCSLLHPVNTEKAVWGYVPHRHQANSFYTVVHYLTCGDSYAPLVVFEGDETSPYYMVEPEVGKTVVFGGSQLHGVLKNGGSTDRIALVVNTVPDPNAIEEIKH